MKGMQKFAKKVILEISQFTFNKHYHTSCVDSSRTHQTALAAQHTFVQLVVCSLILTSANKRVHLAEVVLRKVASRAGGSAGATTDAGLKFRHFGNNLLALSEVVAVEVDYSRATYRKSKIYHLFGFWGYEGLLIEPLGYFECRRRAVIERLGHILRSSNSSRIEYALHLALGVAQE